MRSSPSSHEANVGGRGSIREGVLHQQAVVGVIVGAEEGQVLRRRHAGTSAERDARPRAASNAEAGMEAWAAGRLHVEGGAFAGHAGHRDRAAVPLGDLPADGQADARAGESGAAVQPLEGREDAVRVGAARSRCRYRPRRCASRPGGPALPGNVLAAAVTVTAGARSGGWNLSALPIRFWNSWRIWERVGVEGGQVADRARCAPFSSMLRLQVLETSGDGRARSTGTNGCARLVTRA